MGRGEGRAVGEVGVVEEGEDGAALDSSEWRVWSSEAAEVTTVEDARSLVSSVISACSVNVGSYERTPHI